MKKMKYVLGVILIISFKLFSQHLPLKIGNQWHYIQCLAPPSVTNISTAVDTVRINNKLYYKIERRDINTNQIIRVTYDRLEGDSLYFRMENGTEYLVFNFAWRNGQIIASRGSDSACTYLKKIDRDTMSFWGINTDYYVLTDGEFCPENGPDTLWNISLAYSLLYSNHFGCLYGSEGKLVGAIINDKVFGSLLPVELLTFSKNIFSNSVKLKWSTATETNNYGFEILRNNSKISFVKGNGTTTNKSDYEFLDSNLSPGKYKYELIQIDYDGTRKNIAEIEANIAIQTSYTLCQNYPNPFNPTTAIEFRLPKDSHVIIKIFDCLGNEIQTLVNENRKAGLYTVNFDASNLANGIYFYQMLADNFISTKKMLLLK